MSETKKKQIQTIDAKIEKLDNRRKLLLQQHNAAERKKRTRRLCQRGGHLESKLPGYSSMSDEQFFNFVETQLLPWYTSQIVN